MSDHSALLCLLSIWENESLSLANKHESKHNNNNKWVNIVVAFPETEAMAEGIFLGRNGGTREGERARMRWNKFSCCLKVDHCSFLEVELKMNTIPAKRKRRVVKGAMMTTSFHVWRFCSCAASLEQSSHFS